MTKRKNQKGVAAKTQVAPKMTRGDVAGQVAVPDVAPSSSAVAPGGVVTPPLTPPKERSEAAAKPQRAEKGYGAQAWDAWVNQDNTPDPAKDPFGWISNTFGDKEAEAKRERALRNRLAIVAVGDALRNMGNLYYTTKGAPSQKLSDATLNEYNRHLALEDVRRKRMLQQTQQMLTMRSQAIKEALQQQQAAYQQQQLALRDRQVRATEANTKALIEDRINKTNIAQQRADAYVQGLQDGTKIKQQNADTAAANAAERAQHNRESEKQGRQRINIAQQNANTAKQNANNNEKRAQNSGNGKGGNKTNKNTQDSYTPEKW